MYSLAATTVEDWGLSLLWFLLLTVGSVILWRLADLLTDKVLASIAAAPWEARPALHLGSVQILSAGWLRTGLASTARGLRWIWGISLLAVYVVLAILVLPVAEGLPEQIVAAARASISGFGRAFLAYLPNLVRIIVIVILVRLGLGMVRFFFEEVRTGRIRMRRFDRSWARQTYNLLRFFVIVLAAILIFPLLPGADTIAFQGIAIFIGALISIGASSAISNAVAGIVITYTKAFDRGDRVTIHQTTGDVVERSMFVTRIRTPKNEEIAIPNQLVLAHHIVNYSRERGGHGVAIEVQVGLGYDVDWRQAHALLKEAAVATPGIDAQPEARVFQTELDDFSVSYTLHAFTDEPERMLELRSLLIQEIRDRFDKAGIHIMSPAQLQMSDPKPNA